MEFSFQNFFESHTKIWSSTFYHTTFITQSHLRVAFIRHIKKWSTNAVYDPLLFLWPFLEFVHKWSAPVRNQFLKAGLMWQLLTMYTLLCRYGSPDKTWRNSNVYVYNFVAVLIAFQSHSFGPVTARICGCYLRFLILSETKIIIEKKERIFL